MRFVQSALMFGTVLSSSVWAHFMDTSGPPPAEADFRNYIPKLIAALADPASLPPFNATYWAVGDPGIPGIVNGTSAIIPSLYWWSTLQVDNWPSAEALKFVLEDLPRNEKTKGYHDLIKSLNADYQNAPDGPIKNILSIDYPLNASLFTILGALADHGYGGDVYPRGCHCFDYERSSSDPSGWDCSPKFLAHAPGIGEKKKFNWADMSQAFFDAVVGITLNNDTMIARLGLMDVPNKHSQADEPLMVAAGLPKPASFTMLGTLKKLQYALYQDRVQIEHDCPSPVVMCGSRAADPCDRYPPRL